MVYGDSEEVKNLCGNKTIKNKAGTDITSTVVVDAIARGDSRVKLETGYIAWDSSDPFYGSVQEASEYFAAAYIYERYFHDNDESMRFYQKGLDICASLVKGSTQSIVNIAKKYRSFPKNPNAEIYRSIPAGSNTADDDSTLEG